MFNGVFSCLCRFSLFADLFLPIFFEKRDFISDDLLIFLLIIVFPELIHSLSATLITAFNIVPFAKSAALTAVSVVLLQAILVPFMASRRYWL